MTRKQLRQHRAAKSADPDRRRERELEAYLKRLGRKNGYRKSHS
jgi:hypothetical protein